MARRPEITAVDAMPVAVTGLRAFRISEGATKTHHSVLLRLRSSEPGLDGWAEIVSAPPGKPEEFTEEIVGAVRRFVAPALIGVPIEERARANARVAAVLKGRAWTKAGVDVALHDLQARHLGIPVHDLLGGRQRREVPVIGPVIGIEAPDRMAAMAVEQAGQGLRTIKLKLGETVALDVARVQAVREAVGPDVALRVDANDHYRPADAIRLIRAIERFAPDHVEQPIPRGDLLGLAAVQAAVGVPIMTDDSVATLEDAVTVIRLAAAQRVKVKVTKHGLTGAAAILRTLEAAGVACVLGHVFEMGLAAAAEAHLGLVAGNLVFPCEIGSLRPMGSTADIVTEELFAAPGVLRLPEGPGLGVTLDHAAVQRLGPAAAARG
ncbi:MAG: enolase C-terminal domain-like protein [Geminicoccaceae bacterium]